MDVFATIFTTTGRLNRGLFIRYQLIWLVLAMLSGYTVLNVTGFFTGNDELGNLINGILLYIWTIGELMVIARRLHDLGKDGRFALIALIPIVGLILIAYLLCAAGQVGANKYGAAPVEN